MKTNIRVYQNQTLTPGQTIDLSSDASHHLIRVLRLKEGHPITLFNGQGGEYSASIVNVGKRDAQVKILEFNPVDRESTLRIHLGFALLNSDKTDWIIQKAVELGVTTITPIISQYAQAKLKAEQAEKRINHWRMIAVSAAEQSRRNQLPVINSVEPLDAWLKQRNESLRLVFHPTENPHCLDKSAHPDSCALLIGPEGGLSDAEITLASQHQFSSVSLGPRILRAETAAVSAITLVQALYGDL